MNTTYNERSHDGTNQVIPDWYRRFFNWVACYNVIDPAVLPTDTSTADKSRVHLPN